MARSYTHIKQYYEEMEQMHQEGHSCREIGEKFGFTKEQVKECLRRPRKDAAPRDIVAEQACEIQRLRMENELLRDFLKATERK